MPDRIERIVRKALRNPDDADLQAKVYDLWVSDPDAFEAAMEEIADEEGLEPARDKRPSRPWDPQGEQRATWSSHVGLVTSQPLRIFYPRTTDDVVHVLKLADRNGRRVRAVGGGYSATDAMVTNDYLVEAQYLDEVLPLDPTTLKAGVDSTRLFATQAGIEVKKLNDAMALRGLAMINNAAFDGMTLAGMMASGSHGTAAKFGAVADHTASVTLVGEGGRVYQIEPADGITDRAAFEAKNPTRTLIQEDDAFFSVIISMGSFGVITEMILHVREDYRLEEVRKLVPWRDMQRLLDEGVLENNRHVAVLVNPYPLDDHKTGIKGRTAMLIFRNLTQAPETGDHRYGSLVNLGNLIPAVPGKIMGRHPEKVPALINQALRALRRQDKDGKPIPFVGTARRVLNFGGKQRGSAYALNQGVHTNDTVAAVDAVMKEMASRAKEGQWATAPISLRWTGPSRAYLAPQYGRPTCMIEPPCVHPTMGGIECLTALQRVMYAFDGRPHWGLQFGLSAGDDLVRRLWPKHDAWLAQHHRFSAKGTFDSVFTERMGFGKVRLDRGP